MPRRKRLPLTPSKVKKLAFDHERIVDAEAAVDAPLAKILEGDPKLAEGWQRGRLLRQLWAVGRGCFTESQAARQLGLSQSGFAQMIEHDFEIKQLWTEARIELNTEIKHRIFESIESGKLCGRNLVKLVDGIYDRCTHRADRREDIHHVRAKTLAQLLGVSRLDRWRPGRGMPQNADKTYDLSVVLPWLQHQEKTRDRLSWLASRRRPKPEAERSLDAEIAKCKDWDHAYKSVGVKGLFASARRSGPFNSKSQIVNSAGVGNTQRGEIEAQRGA